MNHPNLSVEILEKIAIVKIDNLPANSLTGELLKSLDSCIADFYHNQEVKVVIITGSGKSFATGADIDEMGQVKSDEEAADISKLGQSVFMKIEQCPKPVIAAIHGFCLGGGLELALSCHMRFASEKSIFGMPEIQVALIPAFGGSYRLPAIVGTGKALQMILTAQKLNSSEALALGLVNTLFPVESLLGNVKKIALQMTKASSASMRFTLETVLNARFATLTETMNTESESVGKLYNMHDLKEGVYARLEKRKPNFTDF
jgi:enoyl-CoA hydratase